MNSFKFVIIHEDFQGNVLTYETACVGKHPLSIPVYDVWLGFMNQRIVSDMGYDRFNRYMQGGFSEKSNGVMETERFRARTFSPAWSKDPYSSEEYDYSKATHRVEFFTLRIEPIKAPHRAETEEISYM